MKVIWHEKKKVNGGLMAQTCVEDGLMLMMQNDIDDGNMLMSL